MKASANLPTVDVSKLARTGNPLSSTVREIELACRTMGGFYVVGTTVSPAVIEDCLAANREFHSLSLEAKLDCQASKHGGARGYVPSDTLINDPDPEYYDLAPPTAPTAVNQPRRRRLYSAFDMGSAAYSSEASELARIVLNANPWPDLPGFRDAVTVYYQSVLGFGDILSRALAVSLGLEPDFFIERSRSPCSSLRLLHYPASLHENYPQEAGIHAHTDFECFSILTETSPGLEIRTPSGAWIKVSQPASSFTVILGDLIEVISNGAYESTLHRVVSSGQERYSLSFFYGLDYDAVVEPTPSWIANSGAKKYDRTVAGEHLVMYTLKSFKHLRRRVVNGELRLPKPMPRVNPFAEHKIASAQADSGSVRVEGGSPATNPKASDYR